MTVNYFFLGVFLALFSLVSYAQNATEDDPIAKKAVAVEVVGTGGSGIPTTLVGVDALGLSLLPTIKNDLRLSGMFEMLDVAYTNFYPLDQWRDSGLDFVTSVSVQQNAKGDYVGAVTVLEARSGLVKANIRQAARTTLVLAHLLADQIQYAITGIKGVASTYIAYTTKIYQGTGFVYQIIVAFADGSDAKVIYQSTSPLLSLAISPLGDKIAYVKLTKGRPAIFIYTFSNGSNKRLPLPFKAFSSAPAWSPDGTTLAFAIMRNGTANIYTQNLKTRRMRTLTNDININTEPYFAEDNKGVFFISDRGGSPQVYFVSLRKRAPMRVTFEGRYNFAPQNVGNYLAFLGRYKGGFQVRLKDLTNRNEFPLSLPGPYQTLAFAKNAKNIIALDDSRGRYARLLRLGVYGRKPIYIPTIGSPKDVDWSKAP